MIGSGGWLGPSATDRRSWLDRGVVSDQSPIAVGSRIGEEGLSASDRGRIGGEGSSASDRVPIRGRGRPREIVSGRIEGTGSFTTDRVRIGGPNKNAPVT